jgi:hypothetical protein
MTVIVIFIELTDNANYSTNVTNVSVILKHWFYSAEYITLFVLFVVLNVKTSEEMHKNNLCNF